jgi:hypothetical protein
MRPVSRPFSLFAILSGSLALGLVTAGCGDDDTPPETTPDAPSAGPDASAADGAVAGATAFVVAGNFDLVGIASTIALPSLEVRTNVAAGVAGGDPFVRAFGDRLYIVNRDAGGNVTVMDRASLALVDQYATGEASNPQDVAVKGSKLYVAALAATGVLVIDTSAKPGTEPAVIDLGDLDPDGHPDCASVYLVGDQLFVACGLLDENFSPRGPGRIAVIDTTDDSVVGGFTLTYPNPFGLFQPTPADGPLGGDLLISTVDFNDNSVGCLERITTGPTPAAHGCLVENADLAGYGNRYQVSPDGATLWLTVAAFGASGASGQLWSYDLATSSLANAATSPATQLINDLAVCPDGHLVVSDNALTGSGVRVYKDGREVTTDLLDVGMPPNYGNNIVCY